jgi:hypothetical protein
MEKRRKRRGRVKGRVKEETFRVERATTAER